MVKDINIIEEYIVVRDGTKLRTQLLIPNTNEKLPVLLMRTPYAQSYQTLLGEMELEHLMERRYIVAIQYVRGTGSSEGDFMWIFDRRNKEAEDSYDSIEHLASLPYTNSKVGMIGRSYNAFLQWEATKLQPPSLCAIAPWGACFSQADIHRGTINHTAFAGWAYSISSFVRANHDKGYTTPPNYEEAMKSWIRQNGKWNWQLPVKRQPIENLCFSVTEDFYNLLENWYDDQTEHASIHPKVNCPALIITGWYDRHKSAVKHFLAMQNNGGSEESRNHTRLVVGPGGHVSTFYSEYGAMHFGNEAKISPLDMHDEWFSMWLKEDASIKPKKGYVKYFMLGRNNWQEADHWPPKSSALDLYFHGPEGTSERQGKLAEAPQMHPEEYSYTYDPMDPVLSAFPNAETPEDQAIFNERKDIIRYTTEALDMPLAICGEVNVKLYASTSAADTDFTAKLVKVDENGQAVDLCFGIIRASRRENDMTKPCVVNPGEIYEYDLSLGDVAVEIPAGHKLRIDISSSNFPFYGRNFNNLNDYMDNEEYTLANQKIHVGGDYCSRVILPIQTEVK